MASFQKLSLLTFVLFVSSWAIAQDSLSLKLIEPIRFYFSIEEGQLVGEGADFLKKEIVKAQFTLLGDYPDSKASSDFTTALLPMLEDVNYKTMALGLGVPSARQLNFLIKEPHNVISKLKENNEKYVLRENGNLIFPMPDMKSVEDAQFIQKAGEFKWNIIGFGYESWNNLPQLIHQMYAELSPDIQKKHNALFQECNADLKKAYSNRSGDLSQFVGQIKTSKSVARFLELAALNENNTFLVEAFQASIESCRMYGEKLYFQKNQLRVADEKRLLRRELKKIDFDINQDKLFVKWDMNFLSRGFQPYAFYGLGNTLSELAEYNGNISLNIGIVPRYQLKKGEVLDLMHIENTMAYNFAKLVQVAKKNQWTVIDLQQMIEKSYYTPMTYLLEEPIKDLIKRYDLIIIPPTEKEATLNYTK